MRRKIAMIAVLGGLAAGLGCQHIAGKSDCGYNPSNYPIPAQSTPYPTFPVQAVSVDSTVKEDPIPIPKVDNGGSDKDVKDKDKTKSKTKDIKPITPAK